MSWKDLFRKQRPIEKGLYSGRITSGESRFRAHLRVEEDGSGILSLNASRILRLNPAAAEIAFHFIKGLSEEETILLMKKRYRAGREAIKKDVDNLFRIINALGASGDFCPLSDLGIKLNDPYSSSSSAPLRMDIALTYRCQNRCSHCYNEPERKTGELSREQWMDALRACEKAAIPHVVFTGGEPTLVDFLPDLIAFAEDLGLVTGLNTNGRRMSDAAYAKNLADAGLDHVQVTVESPDEAVHDAMVNEKGAFVETLRGLRNALGSGIFTMTNTTVTKANWESLPGMPGFLKELGVSTFAVNSMIFSGKGASSGAHLTKEELIPLLRGLSGNAMESGLRFIWYTPTRYCELNPVSMGLGVKQCTAARLSMALEPNGDVIPCQSYYRSVGNILRDDWKTIWENELCRKLREPQKPLKECEDCPDLSLCGGGCPLESECEAFACREVSSGA